MSKVRPRMYVSLTTTIKMIVTDTFYNKLIDNETQSETILKNCFLNNSRKIDSQSTQIIKIDKNEYKNKGNENE